METAQTILHIDLPATEVVQRFRYLPDYARYLLDHKLDEFVRYLLQISRELDVPLLRYFSAFPEDQLLALAREGNIKLLNAFINNGVNEYLEENLRIWKENQLPLVQGDDIVIEDVSKVNFTRRQAFRHFLSGYSTDMAIYIGVMSEIDYFTLTQEEGSYKMLFEMKQKKIREHHHFIDKIANTSPGILYVFDLEQKKQIYANHNQQELLGYTEADMEEMSKNHSVWQIIHPDDLPRIRQHYQDFLDAAEGETRTIEYRVRHKHGSYSWQRGYETVFKRTEEGVPCEIIGISMDVSGEKEATLQLEQREAQLREAQELAGMGSFDWDLERGDSTISPQLSRIFEMEEAGNLAEFMHYVHPSDRPVVKAALDKAMTGDGFYECEYRYRRKGPEKVIWSRGMVSFKDGRAARMKGTVMDITLRHDMVKRLERSEQLHKQAQALTHLGNWSWSLLDDHVEWSDEMYRIFGLEPQSEQMNLSRILSLVHPDDRSSRYEALKNAVATTHTDDYTMRVINPDGTLKFVAGKTEVLSDEFGKPYKVVGTCQDITRQHLLNERLKENEEASSQLINNAPEGIVVIDEDSRIFLWNPKAEAIFGWSFEEIKGRTLMETIIPEHSREGHSEGINRLHTTGIARVLNKTIEVTALKKSGGEFYISLTVSRSVRAGRPVYIAFIRDISNEKATELELAGQRAQLAQKNRELERNNHELMAFNYIASHDLQEPVRKIQIFTNIIEAAGLDDLPDPVKSSVARISSAAAHMHRLIEALIAFSRTSSGERTMVQTDLSHLLRDVKLLLRERIEEEGAEISAGPLPRLAAIPFQLQQLFENIISNAIKYRKPDETPRIHIQADLVPGSELTDLGADPTLSYHRISISDNGIGFEQQYATKIFELFQRLHNKHAYSGTGIGLAICKKIVQNHEGFIKAHSRVGAGTTFEVYLPERGE